MNIINKVNKKAYRFIQHGGSIDKESIVRESELPMFLNNLTEEERENLSYEEVIL